MEWGALFIPIIACGLCLVLYKTRMTWWEILLPVVVGLMIIFGAKGCANWTQTRDTEYWGGYVTEATYYERWDEEVPCSHTKYRTETYTYECGDGKTSRSCTGTRQVADGYEHSYDVNDHPEHWTVESSTGDSWEVSSEHWEALVAQFGNKAFRDMHRSYHSIDGDAYVSAWRGEYERMEPTVATHSYENRVAASDSVLNYPEVPAETVKAHALFDYPDPDGYTCPTVLSHRGPLVGSRDLEKLNALTATETFALIDAVERFWLGVSQGREMEAGDILKEAD